MFKTDNIIYKIILVFNLFCTIGGIATGILIATSDESGILLKISSLCALAALLFAGYYIISGYTKDAAKFYKSFAFLFAVSQLSAMICSLFESTLNIVDITCYFFGLAFIVLMIFKKNLGKKVSLILCGIIIILCVISLSIAIQTATGIDLGDNLLGTLTTARGVIQILLGVLFGIMTYAKYLDKDARGTI